MAKAKKKNDPIVKPNKPASKICQKAKDKVEDLLRRQCQSKFNHLAECCECDPNLKGPRIHSASDADLLNTAYDGLNGIMLPPGQALHWDFHTSLTGNGTPTYVVADNIKPGNWTGVPAINSGWISSQSDSKPGNVGEVYFRLDFVLCNSINPKDFKLTINYLVDDSLEEIYINGIPQSGNVQIDSGGFKTTPSTITLENDWQTCQNQIAFKVKSEVTFLGIAAGFSIAPLPSGKDKCECKCKEARLPDYEPCFSVSWGDSKRDQICTTDYEVLCITACNCYSNLCFNNLTIQQITLCDEKGNPIPIKPGSDSLVEVVPFGPICFGDLGPCEPNKEGNCISRQVVLRSNRAKPGYYKLKLGPICYEVSYSKATESCFEFELVKD